MRLKNVIYITLIVFVIVSCNKNKVDAELFEKPINSVKSIETRYYEPLFLNNKWITGKEINDIRICAKIEYFDEFNNVLLKKDLRDSINKKYDNFYTRTFYFDSSTGKISKQIKLRADSNMDNYGIREYKRDSLGRLISIIETDNGKLGVVWWNYYKPESISYDSEGNKIEKQDKLTTITKKIHSDDDITVYMKQVIDEDNHIYYREIYGLSEYEIITTDTKTGNTIMVLTENIQYGTLLSKSMTRYKYNNNGNIIEEEIYKIETPMFFKVPKGLSPEEEKEYIKENYFDANIEYKNCYIKIEKEYDCNNNLIYENYIERPNIPTEDFPSEFNIRNYSCRLEKQILLHDNSSKTYYEYMYNHKGDWTKRIKYHKTKDMSPFSQSIIGKNNPDQQVEEIVIRKIEYFN